MMTISSERREEVSVNERKKMKEEKKGKNEL